VADVHCPSAAEHAYLAILNDDAANPAGAPVVTLAGRRHAPDSEREQLECVSLAHGAGHKLLGLVPLSHVMKGTARVAHVCVVEQHRLPMLPPTPDALTGALGLKSRSAKDATPESGVGQNAWSGRTELCWWIAMVTRSSSSNGGDAVAVAGIHATIIAIVAAVAVGYAGVVFAAVHAMRDRILDRATEASRVDARTHYGGDLGGYDGRDFAVRKQLVYNIKAVVMGFPARLRDRESDGDDPDVPSVDDLAERGQYLLISLTKLLSTYPLQEKQFTSIAEARQWAADVYFLGIAIDPLRWPMSQVATLLNAYGEAEPTQKLLGNATEAARAQANFDELHVELRKAYEESKVIKLELARYDAYLDRLPRLRWIVIGVCLIALAFATGVALPLIDTRAPRWIYVGVPLAVYMVALTAAGVGLWLWRRWGGER